MTELNRRDFFLLAGGASLLGATGARAKAAPASSSRLIFSFGESKYPILLTGECVTASGAIRRIDYFKPLFGGDRKVVNPAEPVVTNRRLTFNVPGEYYLHVNSLDFLKVLVIDPAEKITGGLLRLFDFFVANNLYLGASDNSWYTKRYRFLRRFFRSCDPMMLSCGPSHSVFREWVVDRFAVPTRIVTFSSTRLAGGMVVYATHNLPEVYVPELGKFVMLDVNSNFVPKWLDAMETAEIVHANGTDEDDPSQDWRNYGIDLYSSIEDVRYANAGFLPKLQQEVGSPDVSFEPALISTAPISRDRVPALRCFYGGAAYWGGDIAYVQPTGTEFLPGNNVLWASLQTNPLLIEAALTYQKFQKLECRIVDPDKLRLQLEAGHRSAIAAATWTSRFPLA
jgi:hypothetical protein